MSRASSLLKTWDSELSGSKSQATPVTRVVNLLKEMQGTLQKDADEDRTLYKKLKCWCNENAHDKAQAIAAAESKIAELQATIESLTAKSEELKLTIKELEAELASDKQTLAEATGIREKELAEFRATETDSIQALEDLKGAIHVLSKHQGAFPQIAMSFLSISNRDMPFDDERESRNLDSFMTSNGFAQYAAPSASGFLRRESRTLAADKDMNGWSSTDVALLHRAVTSAAALLQAHHKGTTLYTPAYASQSGEIFGVLQTLEEEMSADLKAAQEQETKRATAFIQLRSAKTAEIDSGEAMIEAKEDTLATTDNNLAEAKEDLGQQEAYLAENQQFAANLQNTCAEADKNFEDRKAARLAEIQAVSETIEILTGDEARDAMSGSYSFIQVASARARSERNSRREAAAVLRRVAKGNPSFSVLATSVELDSFSKVKDAIDTMVTALKAQQEIEVKKNDWCKDAIHENEVLAAKATDRKADLNAKVNVVAETIKTFEAEVADAKAAITASELALQTATEDRVSENHEFQTTFADQTVTVAILKKASDRLTKFYEQSALMQARKRARAGQTPPVPQSEYKPNQGAGGVLQMIAKLIDEAKGLISEAKKTEAAAQAAYEKLVADTNASVEALQAEVTSKTSSKSQAQKDKLQTESDVADTVAEMFGLSNENGELHKECDYLLKNFDVRQGARQQEVESLQQAKQILNGASLS